jgi:hypothetical protein
MVTGRDLYFALFQLCRLCSKTVCHYVSSGRPPSCAYAPRILIHPHMHGLVGGLPPWETCHMRSGFWDALSTSDTDYLALYCGVLHIPTHLPPASSSLIFTLSSFFFVFFFEIAVLLASLFSSSELLPACLRSQWSHTPCCPSCPGHAPCSSIIYYFYFCFLLYVVFLLFPLSFSVCHFILQSISSLVQRLLCVLLKTKMHGPVETDQPGRWSIFITDDVINVPRAAIVNLFTLAL